MTPPLPARNHVWEVAFAQTTVASFAMAAVAALWWRSRTRLA